MRRRIAFLILVLVGVLLIAYHAGYWEMSSTGGAKRVSWEIIRGDLETQLSEEVDSIGFGKGVNELEVSNYRECVFDRYIEFLDSTACVFYYNKILKSRKQHLVDQENCLFEAKALERLELDCAFCASQHQPD